MDIVKYFHTLRYLRPIQVFGRIWFLLHTPSISSAPPPPIRKPAGVWTQPPLKPPSLLSPLRFQFLNEEHELLSPADWNNPAWEKLWLYHLHYFDDLNAEGAAERAAWHKALIERWVADNPPGKGNGWRPLHRSSIRHSGLDPESRKRLIILDSAPVSTGVTRRKLPCPVGHHKDMKICSHSGLDPESRFYFRSNDDRHDFSTSSETIKFTHLESSGYIRVDGGDMTAFLDVAPIGPDYLPGHAHADTLSFELSLGRQRVIVDSGVSLYGTGPERLRQRGTAAHNTVEIDRQASSEVWGGFRVARRAYPQDLRIMEAEGVVTCAHDGYRRLPGKPVHRREWRFREGGLQIRDEITGSFREAAGRLHFHPALRLIPFSAGGEAAAESGNCDAGQILLPDGSQMHWRINKGRGRLIETTWHPEFGRSIPNQCLEVNFTDRETEIIISWLPEPMG